MPFQDRSCQHIAAVHRRVVVTLRCAALLLALSSCSTTSPPLSSTGGGVSNEALVDEIIDGDTIVVTFTNGVSERLRLLGIDTPETRDPSRPVQCFGAEATNRLTELISPGTAVYLERDVEARDQYGRLLAYVFRSSDGVMVNELLIREGYGDLSIYEPNTAYLDVLDHAVTEARTANLGLWDKCGGPDVALDPS